MHWRGVSAEIDLHSPAFSIYDMIRYQRWSVVIHLLYLLIHHTSDEPNQWAEPT